MERCPWNTSDRIYLSYHDLEWGTPVLDDHKQFEFLILESAQAGLSWSTILKKRENYRIAYDNFEVEKVALYDEDKIEELMSNQTIIRNRRKIEASVNNAQRFLETQQEFGSFSNYLWGFTGGRPVINEWNKVSEIPAHTPLSDKISADLRRRGYKFLGTIIVYSHMQAVGIINDHVKNCFRYKELLELYPKIFK